MKAVGDSGLSKSIVFGYALLNQESMNRYAVMISNGNGKPSGIPLGRLAEVSGATILGRSSSLMVILSSSPSRPIHFVKRSVELAMASWNGCFVFVDETIHAR